MITAPIPREAIKLLGTYTAGSFDVWALAGPAKASCRAHVMSALMGQKMPQSKSGVNAIIAAFYSRCSITGDHIAGRDKNFREFCRATLAEEFQLTQQPATQPKRATFESARATQRVLLTGLDCLPGQNDLFDGIDGSK